MFSQALMKAENIIYVKFIKVNSTETHIIFATINHTYEKYR